MDQSFQIGGEGVNSLQILWEDSERVLCRRAGRPSGRTSALAVIPVAEHPAPTSLDRLTHELGLKDDLEPAWAVRPLKLERSQNRAILLLEDPGGEPLAKLLGSPLELGRSLALAIGIATTLGKLHRRGLIHKDIKPANIVVGSADGYVRLTGFGVASRLFRERQTPTPPETIAGTLAYMAPEQTGRTNRSVDARADLYAFGVTLYQMITGALPFTAADPMEWVHCHIARNPVPLKHRVENVPGPVSEIVMKLLAKTPEERYQTAEGVERDLRRCQAEWDACRRIDDFPMGLQDTPNRLLIPEKLYGRENEISILLACFERIVKSGAPELVLVSGYSGIGKSAVINELHKMLVPPRRLFASGKFDQYKRDIPYATLVQAFRSLVRPLLSKSDAELARWRHAFLEALGPNGRLMIDLIPELELIIGDQPPAPELPSQQAQNRFQLVFRRFIGVFAQPEHPLALFLDDLQWLDAATLDLLEDILMRSDLQHLMLIGAYRDNEVTAAHPLIRKLDAIKTAGGKIAEIALAPLAQKHVGQLMADAFRRTAESVAPLATLVYEKTGGNPFFVIQFISSLAEEALVSFDYDHAEWSWDFDRIFAKGYTDNIIDLMADKVTRLPAQTQNALQRLACLGNVAEVTTLSIVLEMTEEHVDATLWPARRQELVERTAEAYRFVHDRIQEAAYSLITEEEPGARHLRIGRMLVEQIPPEKREEAVFDIVNQLNRGATLIATGDEREQLAEFNLVAGRKAKASAAYASALTYFAAGAALLPEDAWERRHELAFGLELHRAECEFLTAALTDAEKHLAALVHRTLSLPDLAAVTRLREELFVTRGRNDDAIKVCLDYLSHAGVQWSAHPTKMEVRQESERIWDRLGDRSIEELLDLPRMTDPVACGTMDVLLEVVPPALLTDENLLCLAVCRMTNLSLEYGNSDGSCSAYVWLGMILGRHFGDYRAGFRFGKLGVDLVDQHSLERFKARTYMLFGGHVMPWTQHVRAGLPMLRRAFDAASKVGDLTFGGFSRTNLIMILLASGDPLSDVQREAEVGLDFAHQVRFGLITDTITGQLQLVRTLRGLTPVFGTFDDAGFDTHRFEQHLEEKPRLSIAACWYWIRTLQARFFAGAYASAFKAASNAQRLVWGSTSCFEVAEYHFYAALVRAALCDAASAAERAEHLEALASHYRQLQEWAENSPDTFENRSALVGAEIARLEGRALDAMDLYEQAVGSAQASNFVHNEALACELAARFYATRGLEIAAHGYLRNAHECYSRWGADGKVRQLELSYPHLRTEGPAPAPTCTIAAPVEYLDLATVIKVSQAVAGEMVLERLLETLMRTAIEQAGAERGVLILPHGTEQRIVAEATISDTVVIVRLRDESATAAELPQSILHHVLRTQENMILDDALQSAFAADPYIRQRQARSVLCLPLLNQAKIIGVLFLENNLAPRSFAPARTAVLKLLASQAAISLENARLYRDLAESKTRIRRLVDANIIGIFFWNFDGRILEANDAFFSMVGYDREDLAEGRVRWTDMTPADWHESDARAAQEARATGRLLSYEKEFLRKDGSRVPVLLGAATFERGGNEGVAFVLDLTDLKRAEAEARTNEQRYREAQMELAHANRVATMGQLIGSIAHEVNQPISAAVIGAQAALRWLGRQPPDLEEVQQSLAQVVKDASRGGEIVGRIRDLVKKAPPRQDLLEVNPPISEVIWLTRSEAMKNRVTVDADLAEGLPLVRGDRVQLQQVVLNLIINAVEAMNGVSDDTRRLLIRTRKAESGDVIVAVQDSGPGMAPAIRERIFDGFFTTKTGGLGMGLAICRSIIEAHGGRLWAKTVEPRGAAFQFTLPTSEQNLSAEHATQTSETHHHPV